MDVQPPIRRLALKQKEVDPVDRPSRPGDGTAISVQLIHLENSLAAERPAREWPAKPDQAAAADDAGDGPSMFKQKEITPMDPPSRAGDGSSISVSGMLEENRVAAYETEPELIAMPPRRRSRRNRDFVVLITSAMLAVGVLAAVFREDRQMVALALFGVVFLTVILAWVMYGIMDRY